MKVGFCLHFQKGYYVLFLSLAQSKRTKFLVIPILALGALGLGNLGPVRAAVTTVSLTVHYYRDNGDYTNATLGDWNLWIWKDAPGAADDVAVNSTTGNPFTKPKTPTVKDTWGYAADATVTITGMTSTFTQLGFILRQGNWATTDVGYDRFITNLNLATTGKAEIWLKQGDKNVYTSAPRLGPAVKSASIDDFKKITVLLNRPMDMSNSTRPAHGFTLAANCPTATPTCSATGIPVVSSATSNGNNFYTLNLDKDVVLGKNYVVSLKDDKSIDFGTQVTYSGKILTSSTFEAGYIYSGNDLGYTYTSTNTKFRVWAPTATSVAVKVYTSASATTATVYPMTKDVNGTWVYTATGDMNGKVYMYQVNVDDRTLEAVDPYARAVTLNGNRSVVVDLVKTNPTNFATETKPAFSGKPTDATIYELHVRDLSIDSSSGVTTARKGKYLAFTETATTLPTNTAVKTGISSIKDLGVSHVQLQPVYDFGSVNEAAPTFNWGYDPQNYNVPEGSYSSNPSDPNVRINELKQAVQSMHAQGLRVIMDVVYNHVMNPNTFSQESIVPGYFFRTDASGNLTNSSGCGNDLASERPMVRKYIVDSVSYWAKEYHMDGFRFDILGLMDITTFNAIRTALNGIDSTILTLGEGWNTDGVLPANQRAAQPNISQIPSAALFNDQIRDGIKGDTGNALGKGYVNGWADAFVKQVINGIVGQTNATVGDAGSRSWTTTAPGQSVNYVEVHDGLTLRDKLVATGVPAASLNQKDKFAAALVFLSQGLPFMQAGQEFLRTKNGDANSYKSSDAVNSLKWGLASTNADVRNYYRGLISLRKAHPLFRLSTTAAINTSFKWAPYYNIPNALGYSWTGGKAIGDTWDTIAVAHNPSDSTGTMTLPATGTWYVVVNDKSAGTSTLQTLTNTNKLPVPANGTVVAYKP